VSREKSEYNDDVFQFSVGINGVGTKAVNALSSGFEVASFRDGKYRRASFARGKLLKDKKTKVSGEENGTYVCFTPDLEIFEQYDWNAVSREKKPRLWLHVR
jgi:DNA gyrase/topoisomerase IV subunit B